MEKIELEIVAISQNQSISQFQSYAIILGELNGLRKIPIMIGNNEAQSIIVVLENMVPSRPLTHDLFVSFFDKLNVIVTEILIYKLEKSIFYSKIIFKFHGNPFEIDSRTSDAIAIALRTSCPIYTYDSILKDAGVEIDANKIETNENSPMATSKNSPTRKKIVLKDMTLKELNKMLEKVVEIEDYQKAIEIRNEIQERKANK